MDTAHTPSHAQSFEHHLPTPTDGDEDMRNYVKPRTHAPSTGIIHILTSLLMLLTAEKEEEKQRFGVQLRLSALFISSAAQSHLGKLT